MKRLKLAAPVLLVYWAMLLGGLGLYAVIRMDDASLRSLWIGALGGTFLGQLLALRNVRSVVAVIFMFLTACWLGAVLPSEVIDKRLWMAFGPAAVCGYLSLGDRASLAAFWFPAVIWMLSILDRTGAHATPDRSGMILLGGLAVMFFVFMRAREARRIRLWQNVAVVPIASELPAKVLREATGWHIARAGWTVLVAGLAALVTALIAPGMWQGESFDGEHVSISRPRNASGRPCCPVSYDLPSERGRVKEYFDMGRGHDEIAQPMIEGIDCDACTGDGSYTGTYAYGHDNLGTPSYVPTGPAIDVPAGPYHPHGTGGGYTYIPPSGSYSSPGTTYTPGYREPPAASTTRDGVGQQPAPVPSAPSVAPPSSPPQVATAPPPAITAPPQPAPQPPQPAPVDPPRAAAIDPPAPAPAPSSDAPPPPRSTASTIAPKPTSTMGPSLVRLLAVLVACALILQLIALALRPLRRWFVLRHLRRPFWKETVDQQVSNSWQLALVGLRDAGWRPTSDEAPRELARRAGIDGLEQCATILERARHGLGVDAGDLAEMNRSADVAYESARSKLGGGARAASWLRWPLA
ncbi:MAG: hypothetical protein H0T46_14640 [Deltaproteobacteria bacterium]|nr:hypothetical protein [Deltaproteobacteria bacterium]